MPELRFRHPKPGKTIKVIGAGLPRTGTTSFCAALEILLDGPCYHCGVQYVAPDVPDETHAKAVTRVAELYPYDDESRPEIEAELRDLLDGYVAVADPPLSMLTPEILRLYPDAKVIVTVRDRETWVRSMQVAIDAAMTTAVGYMLFWMPSVRWLPTMTTALDRFFEQKYGVLWREEQGSMVIWEKHHEQLRQLIPEDKLLFFDVRDGWEPLCKALDTPVPDVPFPRLNDSKVLEEIYKSLIERGMARWMLFAVSLVGGTAGAAVIANKALTAPPTIVQRSSSLASLVFGGSLAVGALLTRYI